MSDLGPRAGTPSVGEDPEPSDDPTVPVSAEVMAAAQRAAVAHLEARMAAEAAAGGKPGKPAARAAAPQRGARPTAPEDRAVAAARPPPQRLRGFREEDEKVIVAGAAIVEPSLSVDIDIDAPDDEALTPHMPPAAYPPHAPPAYAAHAPHGAPYAQHAPPAYGAPPAPHGAPYAPYAPAGPGYPPPGAMQPGAPFVEPGGLYAAPGTEAPRRRRRESVTVELPRGALGPAPGPSRAPSPGVFVSTRALLIVAIAVSSLAVLLLAVLLLRGR